MADQASSQQQTAPPEGGARPAPTGAQGPQQDNTKAMVAYILTWLTGLIIFLVADKNDKYTRYHAIQAIGFGIAVVVLFVALGFLSAILTVGDVTAMDLVMTLMEFAAVILVIVAIVMMCIKAYKGERFKLPIIGDFAEKNA